MLKRRFSSSFFPFVEKIKKIPIIDSNTLLKLLFYHKTIIKEIKIFISLKNIIKNEMSILTEG